MRDLLVKDSATGQRQDGILTLLEGQADRLENLDEYIGELERFLEPILCPVPTQTDGKAGVGPVSNNSSVYEIIGRRTDKVNYLISRISGIKDRINL